MLLPRIFTAIIGLPLILIAVHFGGIFYMAFVAAIIIICLYEYGLIFLTAKKPVSRVSLIIFGAVMTVAALAGRLPLEINYPSNISGFFISLVLAGIFFVEIITPKRSIERVANTLLGVFLIPWTLAHLINIRLIEPYGEYFTYMIFIAVWISDTMAYFVGRLIGKHRLNAEVSPKKSWEGAAAGFIFAVAAALLCRDLFFPWYITWKQAACIGALASFLGIISDLAESLIKRGADVKDSSNILPGHGGFLDRFDSFLLIAPVLYYIIIWMI
ncbi:MAG: phosphatidate cytidylyltransferase [Elusimicrobiota bacterium]|jgi:phosphatidate cytidylyltransferase|nr:phosphatidate cytidylyltransferase [Elusimicrobiota bacterium]